VTAAAIGVIGVVLGAAIAAFAQQLRPSARSVRGAARLLRDELWDTWAYADKVKRAGSWPSSSKADRAFPKRVWSKRRDLLAAELGRRDWVSVASAYQAVDEIKKARRPAGESLSETEKTKLETWLKEIDAARKDLYGLTGWLPTITQALRRTPHLKTRPELLRPQYEPAADRRVPRHAR
jgi:hypothetical protein